MYTVWKFRRNSALSLRRFSTSFSEKKVEAGKPSSFTHPSAIVHPNAIISEGVLIGPFCTVGPSAKLGSGCQLNTGSHVFGNTELGDHCVLMPGAVVGDDIPGRTVMGCNNIVGHYPVVGVKCQDLKYKPSDECFLDVGDNNDIREHSSIHRSSKSSDKTVIGNNNLIMGSCHIAHDCKVGNNNIFANGTLLAGHVVVGDYAHTAGGTAVHQFCHIGSFSFIGGGSMVSQDVPKYTMVSGSRTEPLLKMGAYVSQDVPKYTMVSGSRTELRGLNLEGLRRHGFTSAEITSLRTAYRKIFMTAQEDTRGLDERLAGLEQDELANVPAVRYMLQSIRGSFEVNRRGICKYRHRTS